MKLVQLAEHLVQHADMLALDVLRRGGLDDVVADPAVDRRDEAELHRALDVAEQNDAVLVGRVLGAVDEGLVEHEGLAVAPDAGHAVDQDAALVRVRGDQAEVIAQRAGEGVAVGAELAAGRQHREHRAVDVRDGVQKLHRPRAKRARRGQEVVVPFQIEALPAALEERVEAPVVVLGGGADEAFVEQANRLLADLLPIVGELLELRKLLDRDHRRVRHGRAGIHQHVVGREIGRVVAELAGEAQPLLAAEMDVDGGPDQDVEADELWREELSEHARYP